MKITRRRLLASTASLTALAGCSSDNTDQQQTSTTTLSNDVFDADLPDPEVTELVAPESQLVSIDQPSQNTLSVTIQNTGDSGNIAIALFWKMDENATEPDNVGFLHEGYERERKQALYFNSSERRTVDMTASPPDDALGYMFVTQPSTHGAKITNRGVDGDVTATLTYNAVSMGGEKTKEKTVSIGSDKTETVLFEGAVSTEDDWTISAEAAQIDS
ncbi:hypothetical protein [Halospeciosus flavus]|uniref:Uncharacterized protein n=1 Tax=Halospeciosus flavus TaxID=3032283 RepID=A0ABD5YXS8_9EURY|nr:hypothetical protein [Halospeciosus flavus]